MILKKKKNPKQKIGYIFNLRKPQKKTKTPNFEKTVIASSYMFN